MAKIKLTKSAVDAFKPRCRPSNSGTPWCPASCARLHKWILGCSCSSTTRMLGSVASPLPGPGAAGRWVRRGGDPSAAACTAPMLKELCIKFMEDYSKQQNKPSTQTATRVSLTAILSRCWVVGAGRQAPGGGQGGEEDGAQSCRRKPHVQRPAQDVQPGRGVGPPAGWYQPVAPCPDVAQREVHSPHQRRGSAQRAL
jgi:hypothetical protein